jgi:hypothetical protein
MLSVMEHDQGRKLERSRGAAVIRLRPLRVVIVSRDRRFRAVTSMLAARRGCSTSSLGAPEWLGDLLAGGRVDVVLVDGMALLREVADEVLRVAPLPAPVGLVLAAETDEPAPSELVAVAKWSPFERVFEAILQADRRRTRPRVGDRSTGLSVIAAKTLG